ncbi:hypothetical protein [Amycolatopsis sp. NBC_00438]|uniref:hypothetical protein n=1 Tax=Amycolatopsis sp. NBC_00438 TaxID=2903558 RepID=UPI002E228175
MDAKFLLIRGTDHVVLGVSWRGLDLVDGPALEAGPDAELTLTFPPQHIAEQVVDDAPPPWYGFYDHLGARLADPSQVTVEITRSALIPLTAEGILEAVRGAKVASAETRIEMPWRLVLSPEAGAGRVTCEHDSSAPGDRAGMWRTSLEGDVVVLRSLDQAAAESPDPNFRPSLAQYQRSQIHRYASATPARCHQLELSSLGGSLSVNSTWPALGWEHLVHLGRDVRVRTVSSCYLYPFGHRVDYLEVTERAYLPWTPSIMALRQTRTIVVTEPVRKRPADPQLARLFPFSEVEIVERIVSGLDPAATTTIPRPGPGHDALAADLARKTAEFAAAEQAAIDALYGPGLTAGDFAPAGIDEVLHIGEIGPDGPIEPIAQVQVWLGLRDDIGYLQELLDGATQQVPLYFWPTRAGGTTPYLFHIRCWGGQGDLHLRMPLMVVFDDQYSEDAALPAFHTVTSTEALVALERAWAAAKAGEVTLPGVPVDLLGEGVATDAHEVIRLNVTGSGYRSSFAPALGPVAASAADAWAAEVRLPAVRALLGDDTRTFLAYSAEFRQLGAATDIALRIVPGSPGVKVDFDGRSSDSGGLIAPQLAADAISRKHGLVQSAAVVAGGFVPSRVMGADATLLGVPLTTLLDDRTSLSAPPAITQALVDGQPPQVRLEWLGVPLKTSAPFVSAGTTLNLSVVHGYGETTTTCSLTAFELHLPATGETLLELGFTSLGFTRRPEREPALDVGRITAKFTGLLSLLQELQNKVRLGDATPRVTVTPASIVAGFSLPVPSVACGVFALRNIVFAAAVEVPFDGRPVAMTLAFASRANPFNLSVLMFGGGGYLEMTVDSRGLQRLEASLEFGASLAVDFGIASAEVHAMGGVRYLMDAAGVHLTGFLRLGGSMDLLGLISVSVEVRLELTYDIGRNRMVGRASLVIEIDLTFYSDSVQLDSGEWEFIGGGDPARKPSALFAAAPREPAAETWRRYRAKFAGVTR